MSQPTFVPANRSQSGGCGRIALIGAGCLIVLIIGAVGSVIVAGVIWDRGSEPAFQWAMNRVVGESSDVSSRIEDVDVSDIEIPEPRAFENRDEYLEAAREYNREIGQAVEEIARLLSEPNFQDDDWNDRMARELARIRYVRDQAAAVEPPEELESAHRHWVEGVGAVSDALDSVAEGIDNFSPSSIVEAIQSLEQATRAHRSLNDALDNRD